MANNYASDMTPGKKKIEKEKVQPFFFVSSAATRTPVDYRVFLTVGSEFCRQ